uniref:Uncharacterized protein n=1 Tax=Cucumis sativus TaxID=3659 RepID=A0A0A0K6X6_CUCSA
MTRGKAGTIVNNPIEWCGFATCGRTKKKLDAQKVGSGVFSSVHGSFTVANENLTARTSKVLLAEEIEQQLCEQTTCDRETEYNEETTCDGETAYRRFVAQLGKRRVA